MTKLQARGVQSPLLGSKPALVFIGNEFEHNPVYARLQNFFAGDRVRRYCVPPHHATHRPPDYFRGYVAKSINIAGIDHAIVFTAHKVRVHAMCWALPPPSNHSGRSRALTLRRTRFFSATTWSPSARRTRSHHSGIACLAWTHSFARRRSSPN